jgi:zinc transport system substrate-binding protein
VVLVPAHLEPLLAVMGEGVEDAGLGQRCERPIDRREPGRSAPLPQRVVQILGADRLAAAVERAEHGKPLLGRPESGFDQRVVVARHSFRARHAVQSRTKMISVLKYLAITSLGTLLAGGCSTGADDASGASSRASVVAAFYPIAEAAEHIGDGRIEVIDLTPPGAEPHDLELTTDALDAVLDADLVLYLEGFQPALDEAIADAEGRAVDLLDGLPHGDDPHVWLDPRLWANAVDAIADAIVEIDPDGAEDHRSRAAGYANVLSALDEAFEAGLASCDRDLVVTAHDAFGHLVGRYGLRQESISGVSPEAEPDPRHLADLTDLVREEGVTTVFTEELVSPKVARALAREAGVKTDVLDPIESEPDGGYADAMRRNLRKLEEALGCR